MAKRFTATEIWSEDWFLDMPAEYKLFWYYLLSTCNHAGLFKVNLRSFCGLNGVKIDSETVLSYLNFGKDRIRIVNQSVWLIEDFFVYQYGTTFNPNNRVHESIEKEYLKYGIKMTSIRGLLDLKDRVKDKDKDKDKDIKGIGSKNKKGVSFSDDNSEVVFSDGSTQKLGESQLMELKNKRLSPSGVVKGMIY